MVSRERDPTVADHRAYLREQCSRGGSGGYHPLRTPEVKELYYLATGEHLDDVNAAEARYRLIEATDHDDRDPFEASHPFRKSELAAVREAIVPGRATEGGDDE